MATIKEQITTLQAAAKLTEYEALHLELLNQIAFAIRSLNG